MPALDVSDILLDPDFCEVLTVIRRLQTLVRGRATTTETTITPAPVGVVLAQSDAPIQRGPDQQNLPRLIQVHTPFRLRSASKDPVSGLVYQPDIIVWGGDRFVVNKVQDFSRYGRGFLQADCSSQDLIDVAAS
ncbi:MAG: putative phage head-tail adaptor [Phenylobacterium sp.]|nr:putative phage head-tail adaptor [Phenylobacterium sp.]